MPKFALHTCSECRLDGEAVMCNGRCSKCGWNPRIRMKRLKKRFTAEQIRMLDMIPIVSDPSGKVYP